MRIKKLDEELYKCVLEKVTPVLNSLKATSKINNKLLTDWENVKNILEEKAANNPDLKITITRNVFIQLWQVADDER